MKDTGGGALKVTEINFKNGGGVGWGGGSDDTGPSTEKWNQSNQSNPEYLWSNLKNNHNLKWFFKTYSKSKESFWVKIKKIIKAI